MKNILAKLFWVFSFLVHTLLWGTFLYRMFNMRSMDAKTQLYDIYIMVFIVFAFVMGKHMARDAKNLAKRFRA